MDKKNKIEYPSMDITYEWGRTAPEQLSKVADALDTKIINIFIAAAIIVGVMAALVGKIRFDATSTPFIIALICFVIILVKCLRTFRPYPFYVAVNPHVLKEDYWILEPKEAKEKYWEYIEENFCNNYRAIESKEREAKLIIPLLALEVLSLILWLLLV